MIKQFFENVYVLNLKTRSDRLHKVSQRLDSFGIQFEKFTAIDGKVLSYFHRNFNNDFFANPNYLGSALSHLSMYRDALTNKYRRILILEDDILVNRKIDKIWSELELSLLEQSELMYLGFIPVREDLTVWDYNLVNERLAPNIYRANHLWGLFAYSPSEETMEEITDLYTRDFPMEVDRYLVTTVQPRGKSVAISPQLFAVEDDLSDNLGKFEAGMLTRSSDNRFSTPGDYL